MIALLLALFLALDARTLWQQGAREEAIAERAKELAAPGAQAELRLELARWELAVHRPEAALGHLAPLGKEADALRGEAHYALAQYEQAAPLLDEASVEHQLMKIDALEALGRLAESDAVLARALAAAQEGDARLWSAEGRRLARVGDSAQAVAAFRKALAQDECAGEAWFGLGRALLAAGRDEEGLQALEHHRKLTPLLDQWDFARRAVDLAPLHAPNLAALGDAERALGRLSRAAELYARAVEFAQGAEQLVPIALRQARLYAEDEHDAQGAIERLEQAAKRAPDARLFVRAGDLALEAKDTARALELFERAQKLRPQDAEIQKRLARAREAK
ncbi:MAG: tetratricopeptide repeat protein [Planctomycetes bacterium]|nr:tetratricopeptide repeat protein [Planctomycetota bacterium]